MPHNGHWSGLNLLEERMGAFCANFNRVENATIVYNYLFLLKYFRFHLGMLSIVPECYPAFLAYKTNPQ